MSAIAKTSLGRTLVLILLGVLAFFVGEKSLLLLIPAALLVYYGAGPIMRGSRN